jgi:hypothetical protein
VKWANPIVSASVTGKQTLTGDRPITALHRAIEELQGVVVVAASATINGTPFSASVRNNTLEIAGEIPAASVDLSEYELGGSLNPFELPQTATLNHVLTWNGTAWVAGPVRAL